MCPTALDLALDLRRKLLAAVAELIVATEVFENLVHIACVESRNASIESLVTYCLGP